MKEKNIGKVKIVVKNGNWVEEKADVLFVPECQSKPSFVYATAVEQAGMQKGVLEFAELAKENDFPYGYVLLTPPESNGVRLAHAVLIGCSRASKPLMISRAVKTALLSAYDHDLKTLVIPERETTALEPLSQKERVQAALRAVTLFAEQYPEADIEVRFVAPEGVDIHAAETVLDKVE
mgnify:CR=1 FL=1